MTTHTLFVSGKAIAMVASDQGAAIKEAAMNLRAYGFRRGQLVGPITTWVVTSAGAATPTGFNAHEASECDGLCADHRTS